MLDAQGIKSSVDTVILEVVKASGAAKDSSSKALSIEPEMELNKDFGLDSLDILELVSALETKFDIEMPDNVFEAVNTVGDLYQYMSVTLTQKS